MKGSEFRVQSAERCALILLLLLFSSACLALPTASTDRVPTENWTYDAMMRLAARGLVPGAPAQRFMGDWQYNREEMAGFVRAALDNLNPLIAERDRALLARLTAEFLPELKVMGADSSLTRIEPFGIRRAIVPAASYEPRLVLSDGETDLVGIYNVTGFGIARRYVMAGVTLSDRRRKFGSNAFSRLEKYFIRGKTPNWEWEIGKDFLWWGPGYSGSLILSDNSPAFPLISLGKDFNFGHHIGNIKITQFASRFHDGGQAFYLLGRRWEKRFSKRFHMGINETAKTSKTPNPLAFVLPSLYLYQHMFINDVDKDWNSFLSIDGSYCLPRRFEAYFDYLVDDMNAPSFLRNGNWHRPRKTGYLIGAHWLNLFGDRDTGFRVEFIVTDPLTYGATRPEFPDLAYTHEGLVIGHPVGGNSKAVFLRLDRELWDGWGAAVEYLGRTPRDKSGVNPNNTRRISLLIVRDLFPSLSITLRYDWLKQPGQESRLQLGASFGF